MTKAPAYIEVAPTNTLADVNNIQNAVDRVATGGTVHLAAGTFYLGEDDTRSTVLITKGVRLEGDGRKGESTIIKGGGAAFPFGIPAVGAWANEVPSGPFRVSASAPGDSVSFVDLQFQRWANEAIYAVAADGLSVIDCTFSDPVAVPAPTDTNEASPAAAGLKFVHALFVAGPQMRGRFVATGNQVDLTSNYEGSPADDEQFFSLFFTSFDDIRVEGNTIRGHDDGVEVIRNKFDLSAYGLAAPSDGPSTISIANNSLELYQSPPANWPGTVGVIVLGNMRVVSATIQSNELTIFGTPFSYAFALSGSNLVVSENAVALQPLFPNIAPGPGGAFAFGSGEPFAGGPFNLGASLDDSLIENNVFDGRATLATLFFNDRSIDLLGGLLPKIDGAEPNQSNGNHISLDSSTAAVTAPNAATILVTPGVHDNTFSGFCGTIVDMSPPGANTYLGAHCSPPAY